MAPLVVAVRPSFSNGRQHSRLESKIGFGPLPRAKDHERPFANGGRLRSYAQAMEEPDATPISHDCDATPGRQRSESPEDLRLTQHVWLAHLVNLFGARKGFDHVYAVRLDFLVLRTACQSVLGIVTLWLWRA